MLRSHFLLRLHPFFRYLVVWTGANGPSVFVVLAPLMLLYFDLNTPLRYTLLLKPPSLFVNSNRKIVWLPKLKSDRKVAFIWISLYYSTDQMLSLHMQIMENQNIRRSVSYLRFILNYVVKYVNYNKSVF